jgi:hypothetical protein
MTMLDDHAGDGGGGGDGNVDKGLTTGQSPVYPPDSPFHIFKIRTTKHGISTGLEHGLHPF